MKRKILILIVVLFPTFIFAVSVDLSLTNNFYYSPFKYENSFSGSLNFQSEEIKNLKGSLKLTFDEQAKLDLEQALFKVRFDKHQLSGGKNDFKWGSALYYDVAVFQTEDWFVSYNYQFDFLNYLEVATILENQPTVAIRSYNPIGPVDLESSLIYSNGDILSLTLGFQHSFFINYYLATSLDLINGDYKDWTISLALFDFYSLGYTHMVNFRVESVIKPLKNNLFLVLPEVGYSYKNLVALNLAFPINIYAKEFSFSSSVVVSLIKDFKFIFTFDDKKSGITLSWSF